MNNELKFKMKLSELVKLPNIAVKMKQEDLDALGSQVVTDYDKDLASRADWQNRSKGAIELALQLMEKKSFPWVGCSNVKFPLLTIAALQFLARVSIMTKGKNLAKVEVIGRDLSGKKTMQAKRISMHLSQQIAEDDPNWADSDEQTKLATSIIGSSFKKTYFDPILGVNISEHVPAMNFVVDYFTKDIDKAGRATHLIRMSDNMLFERFRRGVYLEFKEEEHGQVFSAGNTLQQSADNLEGIKAPNDGTGDYEILEQHLWLDLDGDGYKEPYIVTCSYSTKKILRIVARFDDVGDVHRVNDLEMHRIENQSFATEDLQEKSRLEKQAQALLEAKDNYIVRIAPTLYFTRYVFIPSPDGGVYGLGLGQLLGPLNESVNTLVNQLVDAGTMSNTAGGFLGRGVKIKGGTSSFSPFEWKPVDSTGNDLKNNIFPLPVRDPSNVLFELLGMLVTYSEKVSGATDIMTGISPGQNTPVETSRNTVEQGMMLFSGIYARMHRSFTAELRKYYKLNQIFLEASPRYFELTQGEDAILMDKDYSTNNFRIYPAVSAEAVSQSQRREKANTVVQIASAHPGFNQYLAVRGLLEALEVDDIDNLYPDPQGPKAVAPPQNPKMEIEKAKIQQAAQKHADEMQLGIAALEQEQELIDAKIIDLHAKATKALAEAEGVETGHQLAVINAHLAEAKMHQAHMKDAITMLHKSAEFELKHDGQKFQQAAAMVGQAADSAKQAHAQPKLAAPQQAQDQQAAPQQPEVQPQP